MKLLKALGLVILAFPVGLLIGAGFLAFVVLFIAYLLLTAPAILVGSVLPTSWYNKLEPHARPMFKPYEWLDI